MYGFVFCTPWSPVGLSPPGNTRRCWRYGAGKPFWAAGCTIGEDRAFTNLVLRQGYHDFFTNAAPWCIPPFPKRTGGLCRMFLRWDRSNFRESYIQLKFMFSRYRPKHRLMPIVDFLVRELEFPLVMIFLPLLAIASCCHPLHPAQTERRHGGGFMPPEPLLSCR